MRKYKNHTIVPGLFLSSFSFLSLFLLVPEFFLTAVDKCLFIVGTVGWLLGTFAVWKYWIYTEKGNSDLLTKNIEEEKEVVCLRQLNVWKTRMLIWCSQTGVGDPGFNTIMTLIGNEMNSMNWFIHFLHSNKNTANWKHINVKPTPI